MEGGWNWFRIIFYVIFIIEPLNSVTRELVS